ncbi:hypothetical protein [Actinoalloteichus fjordicus]|uniref:hypothetical protein n=1 Tax=Actinoalloteichus fjordicus TaxID=1612552 RepID=UPI0018DB0594|nr:hypothetical protein [Actinoalloteichus fjordicus]
MSSPHVAASAPEHRPAVIGLSYRAWAPVFGELRGAVPSHILDVETQLDGTVDEHG